MYTLTDVFSEQSSLWQVYYYFFQEAYSIVGVFLDECILWPVYFFQSNVFFNECIFSEHCIVLRVYFFLLRREKHDALVRGVGW